MTTDASPSPPTVAAHGSIPTPTIVMRNYFSTYMLHAARRMSEAAGEIEAEHTGGSRFNADHRGHVLGCILCSVAFLEAMINELYQDAYDRHGTAGDGYIAPLPANAREKMAEFWSGLKDGRYPTLSKYQMALLFAGKPRLDEGAQPFQSAHLLIGLRNAVAHFQPESLSADSPSVMEKRLKPQGFADNALMAGAGNPWWPDHCLGHGCTEWAWTSAVAFADRFSHDLGIQPNYQRVALGGTSSP